MTAHAGIHVLGSRFRENDWLGGIFKYVIPHFMPAPLRGKEFFNSVPSASKGIGEEHLVPSSNFPTPPLSP